VTSLSSGVRFEVERAVSGTASAQVTLGNGPGNCALNFTVGDRYIVYAHKDRTSGMLYTNMCTRTRPLSDPRTRADLAYFDLRRTPAETGSLGLLTGAAFDATVNLTTNAPTSRPLAGVEVSATPVNGGRTRTTKTRTDGSYEITGVPPGGLQIVAALPSQFEPHQPLTITMPASNGCAEADIHARVDGRLSGRLLDAGSRPARGVAIQLADAVAARTMNQPPPLIDVVTDEDGMFEFRYVGPGRYVIGVGLWNPPRPGKLDRRRFYGETANPATATVVELGVAERRKLPPFTMAPLPADRAITIVVTAATPEAAAATRLFLTGATREPVAPGGTPITIRLPFGAAYSLEAAAPPGFVVVPRSQVRIDRDDTDRTIEFRVERK
jgi:hypothetical protein